jgi:hypothetical protein
MDVSARLIMDRRIRSNMPETLEPVSVDLGRERGRAARTPDMEERVPDHVNRDADISTRQVGEELDVSHIII